MSQLRNPFWDAEPSWSGEDRPGLRFSRIEVLHLVAAVTVLTAAFAIFRADGWLPSGIQVLASFVAVGSGFVLHELAHKAVAQRYGHWAEFRAQPFGLLIGLFLALFAKVLFAAPGAVYIRGQVTYRENGLISLVGPGVNMLLAAVAFPFTLAVNGEAPLTIIMEEVARVNALLALFNLIPLGPFDGKKVWMWSKPAYVAAVLVALGLFVAVLFQ